MTLRKPEVEEVPSKPRPGEIVIYIPTFAIGLRVSMAPTVKRFLQEVGIQPFQLSLTSWQAFLGTNMLWFYVHGTLPTLKEYQVTFSLRHSNRPGLFCAYKFKINIVLGKYSPND